MPLIKSGSKAAVSKNISEFHGGKTYNKTSAKFGKRKADLQAVAVALSNARKYAKKAEGGEVSDSNLVKGLMAIRDALGGPPSVVGSMRDMMNAIPAGPRALAPSATRGMTPAQSLRFRQPDPLNGTVAPQQMRGQTAPSYSGRGQLQEQVSPEGVADLAAARAARPIEPRERAQFEGVSDLAVARKRGEFDRVMKEIDRQLRATEGPIAPPSKEVTDFARGLNTQVKDAAAARQNSSTSPQPANIYGMRMDPDQLAGALQRLKERGVLNKEQAGDLSASRLKAYGYDPETAIGRSAPDWKAQGGFVSRGPGNEVTAQEGSLGFNRLYTTDRERFTREPPSPKPEVPQNSFANSRKYAAGGLTQAPWYEKSSARMMNRGSMLHSDVPGRTDKLPIQVKSGSFIVPADIVSGLGQGNSLAGTKEITKRIMNGGIRAPKMKGMKMSFKMPANPASKRMDFADGGQTPAVPIVAAGGEHVITPQEVAMVGHGDMRRGHDHLDQWVLDERKKLIKTLRGLKGPKRD